MPCENYREALIEAAAAGGTLSTELRAHVDACEPCRAAFTEELQLFAAIDAGVRATASGEMPASLLPRVRAELCHQAASRRTWVPAWAALAAIAALLFAVVLLRGKRLVTPERNPQQEAAVRNVPPAQVAAAPSMTSPLTHRVSANTRPNLRKSPEPYQSIGEVAVLIPAGQKRAFDTLLAGLRQGSVKADALSATKPEDSLKELQVAPLDIAPIELKPMTNVTEEANR